jgi:chaperonin GroEL (HSP60 family)
MEERTKVDFEDTSVDYAKFQNADFSDMRISNIGFGKDEYKTSKPNILRNDAVISEILKISEAAETAIGHTIGPYADATLVQTFADRSVPVYNTRDGFTILQNMKFFQPIPNAIFKIIREVSEYLQVEVGDSTSSGIPIQNALLKKYVEIFNNSNKGQWRYSPVGIKNITTICVSEIVKQLKNNPKYQKVFPKPNSDGKYTPEEEKDIIKWLTKVATISANNDYATGERIAKLYHDKLDGRGNVIVMTSKTSEEYCEESNAYVVPVGPIDESRMCNSSDHFSWEADKPMIAMFDGSLLETDLPALKQIVESVAFDFKRPLLIVASMFNFNITQYLRECIDGTYYNELGQCMKDKDADPAAKPFKINVCAMMLKNKEIEEQFRFADLKLMTKSRAFSTELTKMSEFSEDRTVRKEQLANMLGECEHISSGRAETNFIGCSPNVEEFDKLISDLKSQAEKLKKVRNHNVDYTSDDLFNRIDNLQARTTFYYCGGRSEKAKFARKLVVEDATSSVAAAIKHGGVSIGGNISICHYIEHNFSELVDQILDHIHNIKINITAAENFDTLREIVEVILESIKYAFGNAYRYALYNMYRDPVKTMAMWESCVNSEVPTIYNIMTNIKETFDSTDADKCTTLIVPKNTDEALMSIITETVGELINVGNMISLMSPNVDVEAIQQKQLETGAAYMASSSFMRQ